jgi:hypothetical protein
MNPENDALLCERYPRIFAKRRASPSVSLMAFGFECGDGWFEIVDKLCAQLQAISDREGAPQLVATQVKEKFGTLHFYTSDATEEHMTAIAAAQRDSARTCELCGHAGQLVVEGSYRMVRCAVHTPSTAILFKEYLERRARA